MPQNSHNQKIDTQHLYENLTKFLGSCQLMNSAYVEKHFELVAVFSTLKSLYTRFKALNSITSQQIARISDLIDDARQNVSMDNMEELEKQQNQIMFNTYKLYQNLSGTMYNLEKNPGAYLTCDDSLQSVIISVVHSMDENSIEQETKQEESWQLGDTLKVEGPASIFGHLAYPEESSKSTQEAKAIITKNKQCLLSDRDALMDIFTKNTTNESFWKSKVTDLWGELDLSSLYRIFAYVIDHLEKDQILRIQNMIIYISLLQSYSMNPYLSIKEEFRSIFHLQTPATRADQSIASPSQETRTLSNYITNNYFHGRLCVFVEYTEKVQAESDLLKFRDLFFSEGSLVQTDDQTGKTEFQKLYFKSIKMMTVGEKHYIIFELPLRYTVLSLDGNNVVAIPTNVKLKYTLEDIASKLTSTQNTYRWGLYVFSKYTTNKKEFDGELFDLGPELNYYLLPQEISSVSDQDIEVTIESKEAVSLATPSPQPLSLDPTVSQRNKIMSFLHHRSNISLTESNRAELTRWIWYLSVMKARTFGKFMRFVDKENIIEKIKTDATTLTADESQVIDELSGAVAAFPPELLEKLNVVDQENIDDEHFNDFMDKLLEQPHMISLLNSIQSN